MQPAASPWILRVVILFDGHWFVPLFIGKSNRLFRRGLFVQGTALRLFEQAILYRLNIPLQ